MPEGSDWILLLTAYLLGSIPSAVLVCKAMGLEDPRQAGSKNPGATNVMRLGGRQAAILTLSGDLSKGAAAILLAILVGADITLRGWAMLAAVCGHLFPFFSSLRGGKGVATTLGCTLLLSWPLALCQLLFWGLIFLLGRISSLASIATAIITPLFCYLTTPALTLTFSLTSAILILRHSSNIRKLVAGREHRF
ncbi:glycerol-3-phosphate 1-O-acyltransferase PlsY [Marinobacterium stanieri]|uniref:Glycerol-3-phosphate acyltransferase n=1 Tax=Marinobacterium stanieri TaxID=49186 RepID=A0A1N6PCM3_9GAMM|nr:glycerol-3-phosphate 1-O-acyltransferase PlsY [Marinobacterium stanieri]SIQ02141.1 acyl-phosphate glycerol-3-phosphate acyltransferase [Marinobacterium stanieri]